MGIASFVIGIVAFFGSFFPFFNILMFFAAVVSLVFGIVKIVTGNPDAADYKKQKGMAIAGVALSSLALMIFFFVTILMFASYSDAVNNILSISTEVVR